MGRPNSSPTTQVSRQPQEYHFQSVSQSPETIDDAPPPLETCSNENQHGSCGSEPSEVSKDNGQNNPHSSQPGQQSHSTPLASPPQNSPANVSQAARFPPQNHQMRSPTGAGGVQPPQPNPQAFQAQSFPPSQDEPQAFPPHANPQAIPPQAFPSTQGKPQAFPPRADQKPQAFPPPQGEPQAFPPPQGEPHAFPPKADHHQPQAFPATDHHQPQPFPPPEAQPQAFPPQQATFQQQQNGMQFPQNANFFHPSTMGGQMGAQAMPASPFHPTAQTMMNNATPGFPVINQSPIIQIPTENWKTGLFECMNDPTNALVTACFPCVTFGQIAEIIDSGQSSCATSGLLYGAIAFFIAMPCLMSCTYRTKLRGRFGLIETPAPDWLIHCICGCCALCQEYRELKERGLDPSIGWVGNVNKQKQMVQLAAMTPPMRQTMMG